MKKVFIRVMVSLILFSTTLFAQQAQYKNQNGILAPKNFPANRPYWDMPLDQLDVQHSRSLKKTLEYQLNAYHQPNEIYGKETCHGGGSYDDSIIGQSDVDAAQAGTDHFALDATGNNIINQEDATEIQRYLDHTITYLQSHWNFLNENEKLSWFTKMANIYTVDQKQYIDGDETTRYTSGQFATEFILRMQGYNKELTDLLGETRRDIPDKYNESLELNGRGNIPAYFVARKNLTTNKGHGMVGLLIGNDPLNFNHWIWYEPQLNALVQPGDISGSIPFNSELGIYKLENFGNSGWGSDMLTYNSKFALLAFNIDSNGNSSSGWVNPNLLLTKPTVSIGSELNMPKNYLLGNNYPNPFNPSTTINYTISTSPQSPPNLGGEAQQGWYIQLNVYDINGKIIATLINNINTSGTYTVEWNASGYPSGVYFYQLQNNLGVIATKKMLLMK